MKAKGVAIRQPWEKRGKGEARVSDSKVNMYNYCISNTIIILAKCPSH